MTCKPDVIRIDIDDVRKAGSAEKAIVAYCANSETTSTGVCGSAFSTSGPGPGWTRQHDCNDFARAAMDGGAIYYLDLDDGRVAYAPEWEHDLYDGEEIVWTDDSMICLECPSIDDAIEYPQFAAEMAAAVIETHNANSNKAEWSKIVRAIKAAADAMADIDADDLDRAAK